VLIRTVINGLTFDGATKDPMQQAVRDALIGFLAAAAQANAEAIKEAQRGGIALAKAKQGETKYRGRKPSYTRASLPPCATCSVSRPGSALLRRSRASADRRSIASRTIQRERKPC